MWDKVEVKRNNRGIDELKAGDVTNNIFGTEKHCLTLPALVERLHNGESLLLRSQLWAHLHKSALSHLLTMSAWRVLDGSDVTRVIPDRRYRGREESRFPAAVSESSVTL